MNEGNNLNQTHLEDLKISLGLSCDLIWADEFAAAYSNLFNKVKANNDKQTAFKMRKLLIKQIEFVLLQYESQFMIEDVLSLINPCNFN